MFNLSNPRTTILHTKKRFQVARNNNSWTVFFHHLTPLGHFAWHWACKCTDTSDTSTFILLCSLYFFLWFCQWQSHADRGITLKRNIWLPRFWRTWRQVRVGPATCAGLAHGHDYSYCRPWSLGTKFTKLPGHCFSLNCLEYLKTMAHSDSESFSNLTPQTVVD